jgi:HAD superfamily hydrolase (TIGR01549 family)
MAIKAVFFDWFNTLARYEPARDESARIVLDEFGYQVTIEKVREAIAVADNNWFEENRRSPIRSRSAAEQAKAYARHYQAILSEAGIKLSAKPDLAKQIVTRMQTVTSTMHFVLYDDVVPALKGVKGKKRAIGLLTNLDRDMRIICRELGIDSYIDVIVTSGEIGVDKPNPPIFLAALKRAAVNAPEAILVGDQYKNDIVGARGVGMKALLIDRFDQSTDVTDTPRLHSLTEVVNYLD